MSRPTTMARSGMVVTPHYLASQAGIDVLQRGGNAIEAAVAAAATVAVVYPQANSIGGDNFWLIYDAKEGRISAINASGRAGSLATADYYSSRGFDRIPARGHAAANTVPGAVSGWETAFNHSQKMSHLSSRGGMEWKDLLQPAIRYATEGFPVSRHHADRSLIDFNTGEKVFGNLQRFEECRKIFCDANGRPWRCGDVLLQRDLGRVLGLIAEKGAKEFYHGDIARCIISEMEAHDGTLTLDDFHSHTANWVDPISVDYRGYRAYNLPPNTQGMAALGCLNILNNFDLSHMHDGTADYYHLMAEVTKAAFEERDRWVTDPEFFDIPIERILSREYGQEQASRVRELKGSAPSASTISGGDTVWIGVVDRDGNAVSLIQSICDGFGSGIVPKGTGIIMQN